MLSSPVVSYQNSFGLSAESEPTERVQTEGVPTEGVPTEGVPTEGIPTERASIESTSIEGVIESFEHELSGCRQPNHSELDPDKHRDSKFVQLADRITAVTPCYLTPALGAGGIYFKVTEQLAPSIVLTNLAYLGRIFSQAYLEPRLGKEVSLICQRRGIVDPRSHETSLPVKLARITRELCGANAIALIGLEKSPLLSAATAAAIVITFSGIAVEESYNVFQWSKVRDQLLEENKGLLAAVEQLSQNSRNYQTFNERDYQYRSLITGLDTLQQLHGTSNNMYKALLASLVLGSVVALSVGTAAAFRGEQWLEASLAVGVGLLTAALFPLKIVTARQEESLRCENFYLKQIVGYSNVTPLPGHEAHFEGIDIENRGAQMDAQMDSQVPHVQHSASQVRQLTQKILSPTLGMRERAYEFMKLFRLTAGSTAAIMSFTNPAQHALINHISASTMVGSAVFEPHVEGRKFNSKRQAMQKMLP